MTQTSLGHSLRLLRVEQQLSLRQAAARAGVVKETISDIERGVTYPQDVTLAKLAKAYGVPVEDLLEDGSLLSQLHKEAGCETNWFIKPEGEWRAAWTSSLTPREAMRIVQEMAEEFAALKPRMAAQEVDLPFYKSTTGGPFRQAWLRFIDGMQAARKCGVAYGRITQEETLDDLAKKLGETPRVSYGEMFTSGAA